MEEVEDVEIEDVAVPDIPEPVTPLKVECPQCLKKISEHCFKYSHRCKARAPEPPPPPPAPPAPPAKKKVTYDKTALKALAQKREPPMKNEQLIERTPEPPFVPQQQFEGVMAQRQQQAMLRQQAMLAPYQQMFTQCR